MADAKLGDKIALSSQNVEVVACDECNHLMVNLDADEVSPGDLLALKKAGVRISNPETEEEYCLLCDIKKRPSFREKLSNWFESDYDSDDDDDDDDSGFFSGVFGGSSNGGGFGGFGGGMFSGGGAARGF